MTSLEGITRDRPDLSAMLWLFAAMLTRSLARLIIAHP